MNSYNAIIKWGTSRGRDTYGYTTCALYIDGRKVAACNGGGYDMKGAVFGEWLAATFADRLRRSRKIRQHVERINGELRAGFYGPSFHDPDFDPGKAMIGVDCADRTLGKSEGETVEQAEAAGKSLGLERYQAFYRASSNIPTKRHRIPLIDGACGMSSVERIADAIGISFRYVHQSAKETIYTVYDRRHTVLLNAA